MTAPTTLVSSMLAVIDTAVSDVDSTSASTFTPAITTAKIAVLSPAFDLQSRVVWETLGGDYTIVHRIPFEFWVKHDGTTDYTMQRARDIGVSALAALIASDGAGYELEFEQPFEFAVDPAMTNINGVAWLVATLFVSVRDEISGDRWQESKESTPVSWWAGTC